MTAGRPVVADEVVERYAAMPVPRYTSYPTAPHFHTGVGTADYVSWLANLKPGANISLYLHIPYCDRLCWFCGCHTKQTLRYEPITAYLTRLHREIELVAGSMPHRGRVTSVHLGGGSPTMLAPDDLRTLMQRLRDSFAISADAEISIEIDPNDITEAKLDALATVGVTRASLGVQDFDPVVQTAINRPQTFDETRAVVDGLRNRGVVSINLDVLYGLPLQTTGTVLRTIDLVLAMSPDRVALFGYAHVPWMKKHQSMMPVDALPGPLARFEQSEAAADRLVGNGYERVGIDHFAVPYDTLAAAARVGTLHRNFQGYTADAYTALIGFGASAISDFPDGYIQNVVGTNAYEQEVDAGRLPVARGYALSNDDMVRAYVIERLMCDFAVRYEDLRSRFGTFAAAPVIRDAHIVAAMDRDGFINETADEFSLTSTGRLFARSIASAFDTYLGLGKAKHSMAV